MNGPRRPRLIRASELAQYAYCARSWWLQQVAGAAPANTRALAAGTADHAAHGRNVWLSAALRWAAVALLIIAALVAAFGA